MLYFPGAQNVHVPALPILVSTVYLPTSQSKQWVDAEIAYLPRIQLIHTEAADAPAVLLAFPGGHAPHDSNELAPKAGE